ncbi:hypothetical protein LTR48_004514 [Friedmanniomyces endolithicus]|uniref:THO complex subunit 5 n=1 Tax=Rachicladosporium monterosium TaxID=1507873 RepID=A0ABR0LD18_9PEZI|nr:hypothetical protein LTR29_004972 [Friedmanniomyces endolithicus]KAK1085464.1 hypothetical protein LTR48_004514 [Friedmanniomyces endolithicus]KAK5147007.1 hypothetical protein LTR32_001477 [Rachicladosporium monterosium]
MTTINPPITSPALLSVLQAAARAQTQSLAILDLLAAYHAREDPPHDSSILEEQLALSKQQKLLLAHLAQLRGLNRKAVLGVRTTKAETAERRQEIDGLHLGLGNLYYEQRHLRGEIEACEGYEHRFHELSMVPVEEFIGRWPEMRVAGEHEVTIARIEDERVARQGLEDVRLRLVKRKEALVKGTAAKREELGRLDVEVEKWLGGQEGVRKMFEAREKMMAAA